MTLSFPPPRHKRFMPSNTAICIPGFVLPTRLEISCKQRLGLVYLFINRKLGESVLHTLLALLILTRALGVIFFIDEEALNVQETCQR